MDMNTGLLIILGALVVVAVVIVVILIRRIEAMKAADLKEDREHVEEVKELEGELKAEDGQQDSLRNIIKQQQASVLEKKQQIAYLKDWIMKVINLSGHDYGNCPDKADPNKECILCELYQEFVLDKVEEIKEGRDG